MCIAIHQSNFSIEKKRHMSSRKMPNSVKNISFLIDGTWDFVGTLGMGLSGTIVWYHLGSSGSMWQHSFAFVFWYVVIGPNSKANFDGHWWTCAEDHCKRDVRVFAADLEFNCRRHKRVIFLLWSSQSVGDVDDLHPRNAAFSLAPPIRSESTACPLA